MVQRREFLTLSLVVSASSAMAVPIPLVENNSGQNSTDTGTEGIGPSFVNEARFMATFTAYVDTLLPEDNYSRSASAVGVDTEMLRVANKNQPYKRLIYQGCEWLNAAARYEGNRGGKFATLSESARTRIIEIAETTGEGQAGPARFVHTTLHHANQVYYSIPEVWQSLGYNGPPQPNGFEDYHKPFVNPRSL